MEYTSLLSFFAFVAFVSLSGVMMPGPVTAGTIAKGYKDKMAGMQIALGHGMVEFPLVGAIGLGLGGLFQNKGVMIAIGIAGGAILLYIGYNMVRLRKEVDRTEKHFPYHPVIVGVLTTATNPYFFLWWATIGLNLIAGALDFGMYVFLGFIFLHWTCDFVWDYFISYSVFKSRKVWRESTHNIVFGICGGIMIFFGLYFMITPWL